MAETGFTPIQLYRTATASAVPTAGDLIDGELAINTNDGKLFYKNSAGAVAVMASTAGNTGTVSSVNVVGGTTGLSPTGGPITTTGNITLAGTLVPANGGTGLTAPGTSGNVLKSDGTNWTSAAEAAGFPAPTLIGTSATVASATSQVATAGGITITLPASPSAGDYVVVKDGTGAAATTNFTVGRNGSNIASSATDLTFDKNFAEIVMVYIDGTIGWSV
jgi:hypothetical protein